MPTTPVVLHFGSGPHLLPPPTAQHSHQQTALPMFLIGFADMLQGDQELSARQSRDHQAHPSCALLAPLP
jgi:hypothetical protein